MGRTRIERTLKREIQEMKSLRKHLFGRIREVGQYEHRAEKAFSHRWRKRYASTAARLTEEIKRLEPVFLHQCEALEHKIMEEQKISQQEVKGFQEQFEREAKEYKEAQEELKKLEEAKAATDDPEKLKKVEANLERAEIKEKKERKDVGKISRELDSEARDKRLFIEVLDQILSDRAKLQES